MKLRQALLASAALALLSHEAHADGLYISVFGGANFQPDQSARTTDTGWLVSTDADTGFVIGGAIGTSLDNWAKGLRVEAEVSYRRNDVGGNWTSSTGDTGGFVDGNASTFAIMANVWYDIDIGNKVRPYIGGGVGWGRARLDQGLFTTFTSSGATTGIRDVSDITNSGFAWQLGLGINYEVAPDVDVGLGYRYFNGPNQIGFSISDGIAKIENDDHAVQINLTVGIN